MKPLFRRGRNTMKKTNKEKVKRKGTYRENKVPSKKKKNIVEDEEITSEEEEVVTYKKRNIENNEETPQEKRIRLANQLIEDYKKSKEDDGVDEDDIIRAVGKKLKEDVLEATGRLQRTVADEYLVPDTQSIKALKCKQHKLSLTSLSVTHDEKYIYTSSKDCTIVKWSIEGEKLLVIPRLSEPIDEKKKKPKGHRCHILTLAVSTDGSFLASGDTDGYIIIWDADSLKHLKTFDMHKRTVSGLCFRKGTHTLYSASHDRLVMVWNLDGMSFADHLGGHQDAITGIDSLYRESCISCGGRDEMVIVYALAEEKQLRFSASQSSIDGVKLINEKTFVTYGQNGSLALWTTLKKKPHSIIQSAHGKNPESSEPNWLTSVASLINTDLVASGSLDGFVRFWKVNHGKRKMEELFSVPVNGVVNDMQFTSSGSHLILAVGQEHKLGRWFTEKSAKNSLVIIPLRKKS